jgi:hypothetical protein
LFATLIALSTGISDGEARASAGSDPAMLEAASGNVEERIEAMIHRWFAVLEDPNVEAKTLNDLLAEAPFELILDGEVLRDRGELLAWVSNLRATYSQIEHRLDPIRIQPERRDRYRVRFEFDRHALDEAGLPHVARREHIWIVRSDASATPVILRMEERPLLFFPGSGPQIVCY